MHPLPFSATSVAHCLISQVLLPGDRCIDATAGNGHDTLFLRRLVGKEGQVLAIDLQAEALETTARRLRDEGVESGCRLVEGDHSQLTEIVAEDWVGSTRVICFNLGYLPGGNKELTTSADTTPTALGAALRLLTPGGILCVTTYPGHEEGQEEHTTVVDFITDLPRDRYACYRYAALHTAKPAPVVFVIRRSERDGRPSPEIGVKELGRVDVQAAQRVFFN